MEMVICRKYMHRNATRLLISPMGIPGNRPGHQGIRQKLCHFRSPSMYFGPPRGKGIVPGRATLGSESQYTCAVIAVASGISTSRMQLHSSSQISFAFGRWNIARRSCPSGPTRYREHRMAAPLRLSFDAYGSDDKGSISGTPIWTEPSFDPSTLSPFPFASLHRKPRLSHMCAGHRPVCHSALYHPGFLWLGRRTTHMSRVILVASKQHSLVGRKASLDEQLSWGGNHARFAYATGRAADLLGRRLD